MSCTNHFMNNPFIEYVFDHTRHLSNLEFFTIESIDVLFKHNKQTK